MALLDLTILSTVIVGGVLTVRLYLAHNIFSHPLSRFRGQKLFAASHLPRSFHQVRGVLQSSVMDLHDNNDYILRVGPTELSSISATPVFTGIYGRSNPQNPEEEAIFWLRDGLEKSLIGLANDEPLAHQRTHLLHAISAQGLDQQLPLLWDYIDLTVAKLSVKARSKEPTDIAA